MERVHNQALILTREGKSRLMRCHNMKLRKGRYIKDVQKVQFPSEVCGRL